MRLLVTGSREWRDYRTIRSALSAYDSHPGRVVVVHGAATGADHMARSAALAFGFDEEPHFPDYDRYSIAEAPKRRNALMVSLGADVCLAFPTAMSRGTRHCAGLAKQAGIEVIWFKPTGKDET